ncbi:AraC family transcriptional regulator [Streptomyces sp. MMS20-AI2-20]|uniref:AraC family transcriptional regulator n=1 Tax=Streptomyces TaxID=1883 RepID=UPI001F61E7D7|nr:AraC family transcriptional regulator [Streptomyces sp. MMS20-AI2-20]MCI4146630.1 AraC family transcriptional regulator [Streptomyces sp. MMS20-AI2-20]
MSLVRSAALQNFRHCVEALGGDALEYARLADLPPGALDSDDLLVDDRSVAAVLEIAAAKLGCPDLGLRVGAAQELGMLGALAVAIRNSSDVADAMECISRHMFVHGRELSLSVLADPDRVPGVVALRYSCGAGREPLPQAVDMTMLFIHRMTAYLVGDRYTPHTVDLPHRPTASRETYAGAFGAPVRFARAHADLRVPASLLAQPLVNADGSLRRRAVQLPSGRSGLPDTSMADRVRAVLGKSLDMGGTSLPQVARVLSLHPRSLQRQLAAGGRTFATILDDARRERARHYLTETDMPMSQISALLGFSDQAVLSRCARRWWGRPPTDVRREAAETPTPPPSRKPSGGRMTPRAGSR